MDDIFSFSRNHQDDYYKILGCHKLSDNDQIMKEYRIRAIQCHPDKNPDNERAAQEFGKLQRAKEVLMDEKYRRMYDKWLDSGISMPFEKWINMSNNLGTSLHWANTRQTNPMISFPEPEISWKKADFVWERDLDHEVLQKFRNYEL